MSLNKIRNQMYDRAWSVSFPNKIAEEVDDKVFIVSAMVRTPMDALLRAVIEDLS